MAKKTTTKWLAVSLHYGEPWERFLVKAVKPYTDVVLQTGVAERFYFQRSWQRGPNIRLWFKGSPFIIAKMLRPNLEEHFNQYFDSRPSFVREPAYPSSYPEEYKWFPNNSVQYFTYRPETHRFGGELEHVIFEKQYQASSAFVLDNLKEKFSKWTYNEMLSSAIKLHLGFAYAMGMDLPEACRFFTYLSDHWMSHSENTERPGSGLSFKKLFELQRKDSVPYQSALWELFKRFEDTNEPALINWIKVNANTGIELNLALEYGRIKPAVQWSRQNFDLPPKWYFFKDLVKLSNNRLGIFNKNEGFLYYMMAEGLKTIVKSTASSFLKVV